MSTRFDRSKTLDSLDPPAWGEPNHTSHLVTTCHRLRKTPLSDLNPADIRILIGQQIGLTWLVPMAFEVLDNDLLMEAEFYEGDLLVHLLRLPEEYWRDHPGQVEQLSSMLASESRPLEEFADDIRAFRNAMGSR